MFKEIKQLLDKDTAIHLYEALKSADWPQGLSRNPDYKSKVKQNLELRQADHTVAAEGVRKINKALADNKEYQHLALPYKQVTPRFNCAKNGGFYGPHADSAIMNRPPVRSDLSMTIFLSPPEAYVGGEIKIEDIDGQTQVYKGEPGDAILYPSYYVHEVCPVRAGERVCAVLWIQSMVRDEAKRSLLTRVLRLGEEVQEEQGADGRWTVAVSSLYNNLLRMWAENG